MARSNTAPAWRRAFLRELARSGSVALAAEKCGIDRSSAYQVRRRNPAFAASWDRALETGRKGLAAAALSETLAHPQPLPLAGGESAAQPVPLPRAGGVRGGPRLRGDEIVRTSRHGRPCIMRAGPGRWSVRAERAFLAELTATANVAAAARAAGVSTVAVYNRRRNSPAFAAAWAAAKAEGYERIEMLLLHAATATLDPAPAVEVREAPPMNVDQAMNLFKLHRASQLGGKPQRYGWRQQMPDIEDVRASILRKIEAIERAEARKAGPAAGPR
jgi:hypothetical protein